MEWRKIIVCFITFVHMQIETFFVVVLQAIFENLSDDQFYGPDF